MIHAVLLFLNMSGGEIFLILFFVLMFFGSKGIPKIARTMGRTIRQFKDAANDVKQEIRDSANDVSDNVDINKHLED